MKKDVAIFGDFPDNGCRLATEFLGAQSHCLECPFPDCLKSRGQRIRRNWRNKRIIENNKLGYSVKAIAEKFKIDVKTVKRVLEKEREKSK